MFSRYLYMTFILLFVCCATAYAELQYQVIAIDEAIQAFDINNAGQVVGFGQYSRGFVWQDGIINHLEPVDGSHYSSAYNINEYGQIVGRLDGRATLWSGDTITDIGVLPGYSYSQALDINDNGQVIGHSTYGDYPYSTDRAFFWENGVMQEIGTFGGAHSQALAINNKGQVVGWADLQDQLRAHAFIWENGVMTEIGLSPEYQSDPDPPGSRALDINDKGQVLVGNGGTWIWENGNWTKILAEYMPEASYIRSRAMNNVGDIIGLAIFEEDTPSRPFLWRDGTIYDLSALIPADSNWRLREVYAINDYGWIVGTGSYKDDGDINWKGGAYLLIPVPEPSSVFALGLAMFGTGLGWVRRKKK